MEIEEKSPDTRERLLFVAVDVFGRLGYEGASTRALAQAAGVNLAAIPYHFGGKEGLYLATASHIADSMEARIGPVALKVEGELAEFRAKGSGQAEKKAKLLRLLKLVLEHLAETLVLDEQSERWARFIVREQITPTKAFDLLYERIMKRVIDLVVTLLSGASKRKIGEETARLTALTVLGQILLFRAARTTALRQMEWSRIGPAELHSIQTVLWANVEAIIDQ